MAIIYVCDKCGQRGDVTRGGSVPPAWNEVSFTRNYGFQISYLLCPACSKAAGLKPEEQPQVSLGDKILDLITDIAREAVDRE